MSKTDKLLERLANRSCAYTWHELETLLARLGYEKLEGRGSRVKFVNEKPASMINLHKPHPGNELKAYVRRQIIEQLKAGGLMK